MRRLFQLFVAPVVGVLIAATGLVSARPSCPERAPVTATKADELKRYLEDPNVGTILIPSNTEINLDGYRELQVGSCKTIKGTRNGLDPGALLSWNYKRPLKPEEYGALFHVAGEFVRIEGLRFRGPMTTADRSPAPDIVVAIRIGDNASHVQIDNNSFWFWSRAVEARRAQPPMEKHQASLISVTRNYFDRNAIENEGYGVGAFRGYVLIEGNLFNKNRHAVAASWETKGYFARYNYVLQGGFTVCEWGGCYWNQHFDAHGQHNGYGGTAGEYFDIDRNTIRGAQRYGVWPLEYTRPAFMLRGKPTRGALFHDNVLVHGNAGEAVRLKPGLVCDSFQCRPTCSSDADCNLHVLPNWYSTDTEGQLAVGDFDGDGRDDVFLANGTAWWYSSAGLTEWRFLRPSNLLLRDLRFGRFDADARTDVLFSDDTNWWVSSGGTDEPKLVRNDGTRLTDCVFGKFNDDDITDALRADGSTWSVSLGANSPWITRLDSHRAADVRVGDFTGDRVDDIFWIESNTWMLWDPARNVVTRDHRKPVQSRDMDSLVVADFDGDGLADLGQTDGDGWRWLRGGTNNWARLRSSGGQSEYKEIRWALLGRFTPQRRLDAIRYASSRFSEGSRYGFVLWGGTGDAFAPWTPAWQEMR